MNRYKKTDKNHYNSKNYSIDVETVYNFSILEDFIQLYKFTDFIYLTSIFGV